MANVPEIRFKGFTDAWEQRRLGEVAELSSSKRIHASDYVSHGIPFYRGSEISTGGVSQSNDLFISSELYNDIRDKYGVPTEGDLLITAVGTLGNIWKVDGRQFYYKDGNLILLGRLQLNSDYLVAYLSDGQGKRRILDRAAGSNQKALTMVKLNELEFQVPSSAEQAIIGKFFRTLDNTIAIHKRKLDGLRELKKAYLQVMFPQAGETVPRVRFDGFREPWGIQNLGNIGETYTGLTGKTRDDFGMGDARFVTYINVFNNPITSCEGVGVVEIDNRQNEVKYGDIFFTTSSETPEEVGMSSVWLHFFENVYLNSFCFGFRPSVHVCPYYMAFMLRSPSVRTNIQLLAQGISRYNISKTKLLEIEMPFPSIGEQKIIGCFLVNLDTQITAQVKKLEQLVLLKSAYLQKMFI